jgi:hypothetical protein
LRMHIVNALFLPTHTKGIVGRRSPWSPLFCFGIAVLGAGEPEQAYRLLPQKSQKQWMRASAKAGEAETCQTLFDWDSLHKTVVLAPLLARPLSRRQATRSGAPGTIPLEHVHAEVRLFGHNDQPAIHLRWVGLMAARRAWRGRLVPSLSDSHTRAARPPSGGRFAGGFSWVEEPGCSDGKSLNYRR